VLSSHFSSPSPSECRVSRPSPSHLTLLCTLPRPHSRRPPLPQPPLAWCPGGPLPHSLFLPLRGRRCPAPSPSAPFPSPPREVSGLSVCRSCGQSAPELQAAGAIVRRTCRGRRPGRLGPRSRQKRGDRRPAR
jgi:hypothetical protein